MRIQVRFFAALRERTGISEQAVCVPEFIQDLPSRIVGIGGADDDMQVGVEFP